MEFSCFIFPDVSKTMLYHLCLILCNSLFCCLKHFDEDGTKSPVVPLFNLTFFQLNSLCLWGTQAVLLSFTFFFLFVWLLFLIPLVKQLKWRNSAATKNPLYVTPCSKLLCCVTLFGILVREVKNPPNSAVIWPDSLVKIIVIVIMWFRPHVVCCQGLLPLLVAHRNLLDRFSVCTLKIPPLHVGNNI